MTHRILAILDEPQTTPSCLAAATSAASRIPNAEIEAAHLSFAEALAARPVLVPADGDPIEKVADVEAVYRTWIRGHLESRPRVEWMNHPPIDEESAVAAAQWFQTLAAAYPLSLEASAILHAILFRMARPFILVPSLWAPDEHRPFGCHILIAWNGSGGAQRAVFGAFPWLRSAARISVLIVDPGAATQSSIEVILREHGVRHDIPSQQISGPDKADDLLQEAYRVSADLIVMGAYTANEDMAGNERGITRRMFSETTVPLFMAH